MKEPKSAKLCSLCHDKKALFVSNGNIKYEKSHNLCYRCFRSLRDSLYSKVFNK